MLFRGRLKSGEIKLAGKWFFRFVLIGVVAGLGAVSLHYLCSFGMHFIMDMIAGYRPPIPAGEHLVLPPTETPFNRWVLLFLPAAGGLVCGWLVFTFAPEAEGHGTDAAIDAYHNKGGFIRGRIPFIKTIASAFTLTTGGSGGPEGPIAQIGAGFGSFVARKLQLSQREVRIMMAAGVSAGVGCMFRAPLAGALFAAEVLYRDPDIEPEVIIPAGIASVVAYCVFCLAFGWGSLFESPDLKFQNPLELGPYIVLAGILVLVAVFYIKVFYGITALFKKVSIPNYLKPAIGGLFTGIIGFFLPYTLAFGYGYIQKAISGELAITALVLLALGKILTTSFTIGSGGSGGLFGPSIVIGGAIGGAVGQIFHFLMPAIVTHQGAFVIVGMAGFFSALSNSPISTIIFISEISNSYHLLLPSLLVCSICYLLSKRWTIFESQVQSRVDSPAHAGEVMMDILQTIKVGSLSHLFKDVPRLQENLPFSEFKKIFTQSRQHYFPVVNKTEELIGIFSATDFREVLFSQHIEDLVVMKDIMVSDLILITPSEHLNTALLKLTKKNIDALPVVNDNDPKQLIGLLYRRDIIRYYNEYLETKNQS